MPWPPALHTRPVRRAGPPPPLPTTPSAHFPPPATTPRMRFPPPPTTPRERSPPLPTTPLERSPPPPTTAGWTGPIPGSRGTCSTPSYGSTNSSATTAWLSPSGRSPSCGGRASSGGTRRSTSPYEVRFAPPCAFQGSRNGGSWSSRGKPGAIRTPSPRRIPGTPAWTWEAASGPVPRSWSTTSFGPRAPSLDVGAGVRVKIPPDAFVRTRFQHARLVAFHTLGRFTATAFWDARDGFGESNQVDLERWLALPTLLRWSNSLDISEKSNGWTWGTELSLLHKISPKSAITFAGGVSGSTRPAWIAQNYRVLARYRRNVWRKWLFLEGEPDIHWPRKEDGSRKPVWGATLRVEILFTGAEPDPPPPMGGACLDRGQRPAWCSSRRRDPSRRM